jgi:hypothetical protein
VRSLTVDWHGGCIRKGQETNDKETEMGTIFAVSMGVVYLTTAITFYLRGRDEN